MIKWPNWLNFKQGKVDLIFKLPYESTDEILDANGQLTPEYQQYQLQQTPAITVQYYGFLTTGKVFGNKKVRQAFCYAVDRQKLVDFTLKGAATPAFYGRVPTAVPDYDHQQLRGYNFQPQRARMLLAEAGFPDGKGFPEVVLQVNSGAKRNEQVAEAVAKMLEENLQVKVRVEKLAIAQHYETVEAGKVNFWRAQWAGDYPDAENFLNFLWSKHLPADSTQAAYLNTVRYNNPHFDQLLTDALATQDLAERNRLYVQAEQMSLDDAVSLYLFYDKDRRLLQPHVRNCPQNAMEYRNFVDVFLVPKEQ